MVVVLSERFWFRWEWGWEAKTRQGKARQGKVQSLVRSLVQSLSRFQVSGFVVNLSRAASEASSQPVRYCFETPFMFIGFIFMFYFLSGTRPRTQREGYTPDCFLSSISFLHKSYNHSVQEKKWRKTSSRNETKRKTKKRKLTYVIRRTWKREGK